MAEVNGVALLNTADVAKMLGVSEGSVHMWRARGVGPKYIKMGRPVFYRAEDVRAWIESCLVDPASRKSVSADEVPLGNA